MKTTHWLLALSLVAVAGCSQEAKDDYSQAGQAAGTAAQKTGEAISTDAKKTSAAAAESAAKANESLKKTAANTKKAADNAMMTGKVKQALLAASGLDAKEINVETIDNTIYLRGTVPDAKQKTQAESLAADIAGTSYTVKDELTIVAK